jgi:hypothetical protein
MQVPVSAGSIVNFTRQGGPIKIQKSPGTITEF